MRLLWKIIKYIILLVLLVFILGITAINVSPKPFISFLKYQSKDEKIAKPVEYDNAKKNITLKSNITYPSKYVNNKLDIYSPKNGKAKSTIFWIHGGVYFGGDKTMVGNWATLLADKGYNVVAINYALAPDNNYPIPLKQATEAYNFLNTKQNKLNLDLSKTIIAGDSAGAQIASQFITIQTNRKYSKLLNIKAVIPEQHLKGSILFCGPYDLSKILDKNEGFIGFFIQQIGWAYFGDKNWKDSENIKQIDIIKYINQKFPPSFISDGNYFSFEDSARSLEKSLKAKNVPVDSLYFPKKDGKVNHEYQFHLRTKEGEKSFEQVLKYLNKLDNNKNN